MRIYELCLIVHNDSAEEQQDQILASIAEIITRGGGTVLKTEKWGRKNFKFLIKKQSKGHYCFLVFESAPSVLSEIERSIMYNESVLRYNVVRLKQFLETSSEPAAVAAATDTATETASDVATDTAPEAATDTVTDSATASEVDAGAEAGTVDAGHAAEQQE